jgi:hypothetical protein
MPISQVMPISQIGIYTNCWKFNHYNTYPLDLIMTAAETDFSAAGVAEQGIGVQQSKHS